MIKAVFASGKKGEFGKGCTMPWPRNSRDMKNFRSITHNTITVMGKKTADSMPLPLPYRIPIIVSSTPSTEWITISHKTHDILEHLRLALNKGLEAEFSIIGGTSLLTVENLKRCDEIYYTEFKGGFPEADVYLDESVLSWLAEQEKEVLDDCEDFTLYKVTNETV